MILIFHPRLLAIGQVSIGRRQSFTQSAQIKELIIFSHSVIHVKLLITVSDPFVMIAAVPVT
jgi:hypothetical protein